MYKSQSNYMLAGDYNAMNTVMIFSLGFKEFLKNHS